MIKQTIHDNWSVRAVDDLGEVPSDICDASVPAQVPGCVHTDLLRAGRIPDPYLDLNEYKLQWIGQTDWEYRTAFHADEKLFDHERIDLVFDGLDTVATIELNGTRIGQTQNMFRSYRFDVRQHLKHGTNELRVTFASAVKYAFAMREKLGNRPWVNGAGGPFNFIRKMACNFGWDWGPVLVTCGIWKAVRLEGWRSARIEAIRPRVLELTNERAFVETLVDVEFARGVSEADRIELFGNIRTHVDDDGEKWSAIMLHSGKHSYVSQLPIENPSLWSPREHGEQARYVLEAHISQFERDSTPTTLDERLVPIGLRTVELDTAADSTGSKFVLKVNGKPIFCKGFNWIPDDCFLDRACDPSRYRKRIQQAIDAGANMLRVWGGGIYETDDFYNICDELGVMVWQDFPFACAMYPEEEPFASEVEAEARENVARLSSHPSLVLWNGNNENLWAYRDWGWKEHPDVVGKTWGKNFYLNLLPKIVKEIDPSRPYWAASPWSGDPDVDNGVHPNDPNHGNMHVWGPWFREDYVTYRKSAPRFCSEFGFQAPANYATIARSIGEGSPPRDFGSIHMRHRQKSGNVHDDGDLRNLRHLARHFNLPGVDELIKSLTVPEPRPVLPPPGTVLPLHTSKTPSLANFDDLHYLLQLNQCRALTLGVEWFRSRQPTCMGTLYWQLNDCWPVTSWAAIDGDGRLKPLWYATRRFYAPQLMTIQPDGADYKPGDPLTLFFINETDWGNDGLIRVTRQSFDGTILAEQRVLVPSTTHTVTGQKLDPSIVTPANPTAELITTEDPIRTLWFFAPDRALHYPPPRFEADLQSDGDEHRLKIRAKSLIRDAIIAVDRIDRDATIDDNCITLLPGDARTFTIRSKARLDREVLTSAPVFQCANRFGAQS
jgi:beta-mannosidase